MNPHSPTASCREGSPAPTLKNVAELTGFHITTISRALRDHPSIPEATRHTIREAATSLGYQHTPVLSALTQIRMGEDVGSRPERLAFLPTLSHDNEEEVFEIMEGAAAQARLLGFELVTVLSEAAQGAPPASFEGFLRRLNACGTIHVDFTPCVEGGASRPGILVYTSRSTQPGYQTTVQHDHAQAASGALAALVGRGYKRIGLVLHSEGDEETDRLHIAGYLAGHMATSAQPPPPPHRCPTGPQKAAARAFKAWVSLNSLDALLLPSALPLLEGPIVEGLGLATLQLKGKACGAMAGIRPQYHMMGRHAVTALVNKLRKQDRHTQEAPCRLLVQGCWEDGASAPKRP